MEYQSIVTRFQLKIQKLELFKSIPLDPNFIFLYEDDYFVYEDNWEVFPGFAQLPVLFKDKPDFPQNVLYTRNSSPREIAEINQKNELARLVYSKAFEKWKQKCIYSDEGRTALKTINYYFLNKIIQLSAKYNWKNKSAGYIEPELATIYFDLWDEFDPAKESLENILIYGKMWKLCFNKAAYESYLSNEEKRMEEWDEEVLNQQEYQRFKKENYTWEDSYRDGGGGEEWSDSSDFWS